MDYKDKETAETISKVYTEHINYIRTGERSEYLMNLHNETMERHPEILFQAAESFAIMEDRNILSELLKNKNLL